MGKKVIHVQKHDRKLKSGKKIKVKKHQRALESPDQAIDQFRKKHNIDFPFADEDKENRQNAYDLIDDQINRGKWEAEQDGVVESLIEAGYKSNLAYEVTQEYWEKENPEDDFE
ncbi:MAG: hypothetical protein ACTSQL_07385 [Promethearchaeota archaeon]